MRNPFERSVRNSFRRSVHILPTGGPTGRLAVAALATLGIVGAQLALAVPASGAVPGAPTNVKAVAHAGGAKVTWTLPGNGGTAIEGFTVTSTPQAKTCKVTTATATSCTMSGLTNGDTYTFKVKARNASGTGPASTASNPVTPLSKPATPTDVVATAGNASVNVKWTGGSNGGTPITKYTATSTPTGKNCTTKSTSCTVSNLVNGRSYTFTVVATNGRGTSTRSTPSNKVTPVSPPVVGPKLTGSSSGNQSVTVTWTDVPAATDGGTAITAYTVTALLNTTKEQYTVVSGTATTGTVTGLTNGTTYRVTVVAKNGAGTGPPTTSGLLTPSTVPSAPAKPVALVADNAVEVTWKAPADNGTPISSYTVTTTPTDKTCSPATLSYLSCYVTGLTNGSHYKFTVTARNGRGPGSPSPVSTTVVPATVPAAPTGVKAIASNASAKVSWNAPTGHGSSISNYVVISTPTGKTCTTGSLTCTVKGLHNGTTYTFRVRATNTTGIGPASSPSPAVIPATIPGIPTNVVGARGNHSVTVSWSAPTTGGTKITGYGVLATTTVKSCTTTSHSCSVTGLTNGLPYKFRVYAKNGIGASPYSTFSQPVTPASPPIVAPTITKIRSVKNTVTVTWTDLPAGDDGGSPITNYAVKLFKGTGGTAVQKVTASSTATSQTFTGLVYNVHYHVTIAAVNTVGDGPQSTSSSVVPTTVPDPPAVVNATVADHSAEVTWTAATTNGSTVTGYTVISTPGTQICSTTGTLDCYVYNLTNGTKYNFRVKAANKNGTSTYSLPSNTVVPAPVPSAPFNISATKGNASAGVAWSPSATTNGSPVTKYTATSYGEPKSKSCVVTAPTHSCTVTQLINGKTYWFRVHAQNSYGTGPRSFPDSNVVKPLGPPTAPTDVTTISANMAVEVFWKASTPEGTPITKYTVTSTPTDHTCVTTGALSCAVIGLKNGTAYTFKVHATNGQGNGPTSAASTPVTPYGTPTAAPLITAATTGNQTVTLKWDLLPAATDGGSPIESYILRAYLNGQYEGSTQVTATATTGTIKGLVNGDSYTVKLVARNAGFTSPAAIQKGQVPSTIPNSPINVAATGANGSAQVFWTAPTGTGVTPLVADGGAPISKYVVTATPGGRTCTSTTADTCLVTGLTNGDSYKFSVVAYNKRGPSLASTFSKTVTPSTLYPSAPLKPVAVAHAGSAAVSWTPPATDGGSTITGYLVTSNPTKRTCETTGH